MPARYVHLVDADVDEAILKHNGIIIKEDKESKQPKICSVCKMPNSSESNLCNRCGKHLDLKKALELEKKANQDNFMANKMSGKYMPHHEILREFSVHTHSSLLPHLGQLQSQFNNGT